MGMAEAVGELRQLLRRRTELRIGTVVSVAAPLVTVAVGNSNIPMPYLASYTPAANDTVNCLVQQSAWLCIGKTA